jgi:hypothetical protein
MNIIEVLHEMFRPFFRNLKTWAAWIAILKAIFALPMEPEELEVYRRHTGRQDPPSSPAREAWLVVGRRGGKSRIAALIAVFLACFRDYSEVLSPGERGTVMVIAADRKQARITLRYIVAFLEGIPMLKALIVRRIAEEIDLSNGITIEVHTCNFRAIRGYSVVAAVFDEVSYWRSEESANPDVEIANSIRPAMATVPGALLLGISSPYARRGLLWEMHRAHYGKEGDEILVVQADTGSMNPTVDKSVIARAYEEDEAVAAAEYGAEFRRDIETFVPREVLDRCVVPGRGELPPAGGCVYQAFVDPSGGSSDSFTLAIAHNENGKGVLDVLRERKPPFSPEAVVAEFAALLKTYRVGEVTGDRYGGEWPRERFREHGIEYRPSEKDKSSLYQELLPSLNSGRSELLDNDRLIGQLTRLERRTGRTGKDAVDHPPNTHDDLANAAAGVLVLVSQARIMPGFFFADIDGLRPSERWAQGDDL